VAAAQRGVRVRVVLDGFGSRSNLPGCCEPLSRRRRRPGGVPPIDRWWSWFQPGQLRRLHQKLCVVDGEVAFVGGINMIDDRIDLVHGWSEQPRLDFAVQPARAGGGAGRAGLPGGVDARLTWAATSATRWWRWRAAPSRWRARQAPAAAPAHAAGPARLR
jgi:hypothetical protein